MDWSRGKLWTDESVDHGIIKVRFEDQNKCGDSEDILEILFIILRSHMKDMVRKRGNQQFLYIFYPGHTAHGIYSPDKCYLRGAGHYPRHWGLNHG